MGPLAAVRSKQPHYLAIFQSDGSRIYRQPPSGTNQGFAGGSESSGGRQR